MSSSNNNSQHMPKKCKFCGAELEPRTMQCMGRTIQVGTQPCTCEVARKAQAQAQMREQQRETLEQAKAREAARLRAGVPRRYLGAQTDNAAELAQIVSGGNSLYISGSVGVGKTYLAVAVCTQLQALNVQFEMLTAVALIRKFEDAMRSSIPETQILKPLLDVPVLVIDDLGKERVTNWTYERVFDLLDMRYNDLKPCVITSNFNLAALAKRLAKNGCSSENAQALVSRLKHTAKVLNLQGQDRRLGVA